MPAYRVNGKFVSKDVYEEFHKLQEQEQSQKKDNEMKKEDKAEKAIKENKEYKEKAKSTRKKKESNTPHLTCIASGHSRITSWKYLEEKANNKNTTVAQLMEWYICKNVASQMRKKLKDMEPLDALMSVTNKDKRDNVKALIKSDEDALQLLNMNSKAGGRKKKEETSDDDQEEVVATDDQEEVEEEIDDSDLEGFDDLEEEVEEEVTV